MSGEISKESDAGGQLKLHAELTNTKSFDRIGGMKGNEKMDDRKEMEKMKYDPAGTFVTSDHHFGSWKHNPCPWRPPVFSQEKEEALVAKWNSVVKPTDLVIHVGDFCDGGVADLMAYRKHLNGGIVLVKGNHDILPDEVYGAVFQSVCEVLVIEELHLMFQHCPSTEEPSNLRRVFRHFHNAGLPDWLDDGRAFCSCVMNNGGYPVSLTNILETVSA